ncbi:MAG TPA: disulfide bond formation protein B [Candidatus Peribacterales bacterium]|nr:disulfide bond formation protein B [Candidatus Peribacterales bacterium]
MYQIYEITRVLSIMTMIGQVIAMVTVIGFLFFRRSSFFWDRISKHAFFLAFVVAAVSTLGSLFFSEIAEYTPCKLCWFQRVFMYPLSLFYLLAFLRYKQSKLAEWYGMVMCSFGGVIATYHYFIQMTTPQDIAALTPCTVGGVSCTQYEILHFGYITIPLMALTGFVLIFLLMVIRKRFPSSAS